MLLFVTNQHDFFDKTQIMEEYFFQCPYCWEQISMLFDSSIKHQIYIEDCEVCCNPIEIKVSFQKGDLINITPKRFNF